MAISDKLKRGTLDLPLLALLSEQDMYAYQLAAELTTRSESLYTIQEASMYTALYRLEEKKYISSYKEQVGKRLTRIYYHLEEPGLQYLQEITKEYDAIIKGIANVLTSIKKEPSANDK